MVPEDVDGVELLVIDECARIAFAEGDIARIQVGPSPLGHRDLRGISFDADDASVDADHLSDLKRDVTRAAAEVEHPHSGEDAAAPQQQRCRFGDQGSLYLQTRDLGVVAAQ